MFWRIDLYQQKTTVEVPGKGLLAMAVADSPEQRIFGDLFRLKEQLEFLGIQCRKEGEILHLSTYGVPFVVDSPDFRIKTEIEEDWTLIQSPTVFNHKKVWAYYEQLSTAIEPLRPWNADSDRVLYPEFRQYYQKLIDAVAPGLDADKIKSESRHALCVCSPPEERDGQLRLGLSGVMQLLGYKIPDETERQAEPSVSIDGLADDPVLALVADCTLIFKRQSEMLFKQFGVADLSAIASHASKRLEAARADSDAQAKRMSNPKPPPKNAKWEEIKDDAIAKLSKLDVPMPRKF